MDVEISEVSCEVRSADQGNTLSPSVLEQLVRVVKAAIEELLGRKKRQQEECRIKDKPLDDYM